MCSVTTEQEGMSNPENAPLHLSSSVSPTNGDLVKKSSDERSPRSSLPDISILEDEDESKIDESKIDPILVSLSLSQTSAKGKNILSILDDGNVPLESSFLVSTERALSENGSISEAKESNESESFVGAANKKFCAGMILLPDSVCEGSTEFAEQMDVFMRCQHPLDILSLFQEDGKESSSSMKINHTYSGGNDGAGEVPVHRVSGYHALPQSCEYCGSPDINLCKDSPDCDRPKSYFPRGKPPFYSKGGSKWREEKNGAPFTNLTQTQKQTWQL